MSTEDVHDKSTGVAAPPAPQPPGEAPIQPVQPVWPGNDRSSSSQTNSLWTYWHTLALLAIVVAVGLFGMNARPFVAFLATVGLLVAFTAIAGHGVVGLWRGLLIDERNRLSLSRLQMVLWTVVVLSGFLAAVLWNISQNLPPFLSVAVPAELWMVMGITTTSLVGSPLILSQKAKEAAPATPAGATSLMAQAVQERRDAAVTELKETLASQGLPPDKVEVKGSVVAWTWPSDARAPDLFQGDEVANAAHLDLGKVQMLFFTLILVFAYIVMICRLFISLQPGGGVAIQGLPPLEQGMVALLGISHAGYLTNKAIPRG